MLGPEYLQYFMQLHNIEAEFIQLKPSEAATSQSAATALGCPVAQIAKNIVLIGSRPYLLVISGDMKVDMKKFSEIVGEKVRLATPDEVLEATGYKVGAVPPFGHLKPLKVYIDVSVKRYDVVFTSGGSDSTLLKISVKTLLDHAESAKVDVGR
jgi:Cys-tRNA(Pro) deacylase